ncbi:MAG: hypothetical protein GXP19_03390, partial [Gammaproteobacteria bacterium]|nr:hypothetical protein [Gammaproteobacteria bacterium]
MLILKSSNLQNLFILIFLIILSGNPNTSFSDPIAEITTDIATDITIRHITPNTVRYGKKTDIDVIFKENTTITRAFLSPGGPYISDSLKKYLPDFAAINDTLITNNKIFIATIDGDILSLSINNRNQARKQTSVSKIHVNSPVLKLVYLESRIFALTQSGFLYSIKLPSFKVE